MVLSRLTERFHMAHYDKCGQDDKKLNRIKQILYKEAKHFIFPNNYSKIYLT